MWNWTIWKQNNTHMQNMEEKTVSSKKNVLEIFACELFAKNMCKCHNYTLRLWRFLIQFFLLNFTFCKQSNSISGCVCPSLMFICILFISPLLNPLSLIPFPPLYIPFPFTNPYLKHTNIWNYWNFVMFLMIPFFLFSLCLTLYFT